MKVKIAAAVSAAIAAALFSYMIFQDVRGTPGRSGDSGFTEAETSAPDNFAAPVSGGPAGEEAASGNAAAKGAQAGESGGKKAPDEKLAALEKMKKEAGKSGASKLYIVKCSSCHGRDGKGPVGPSIAGKDAEHNMAALMKYKNGLVPNTLMKGILENTSEERLRELAAEISSLR